MNSDNAEATVALLKSQADRAMAQSDPRTARDLFQRAVSLAPARFDLWIGLAACQRAAGDPRAALQSVEGALAAEPRNFPALLMKGSLLESLGETTLAATIYGTALSLAPPTDTLAPTTRKAIAHAEQVHMTYVDNLAQALKVELAGASRRPTPAEQRRLDVFIEATVGRRKIYRQEPAQFHYPGLPAIEFYDRDLFPWLEALEERTDAIRAEVLNVWADGSPDLVPYLNYPDGVPLDQWATLNRSLSWSAYHLLKDGERVEAHCAQCPATVSAAALIDQPHVPSRSPTAMFSILKPHTRIPSHNGVANTRLVLHLPLVVPDHCGFRVGGETRRWREGEAWVFDDTIDHEAWNDSGQPRAILICDVWSPFLSKDERDLIARLLGAMDRFNGVAPSGGDL
jgi:aspartyl/asparaginyl beta-hydroxylase (cupin superfamily)